VKPLEEFYKDRSRPDGYMYHCKACHKVCYAARNKEYYKEHREEIRAYQKEYNAEHRDERKEWYEEHREEALAYQKEYREEHRAESAAYYKEHRDEIAAYHKEYAQTAEGREVNRKACSKYGQTAKGKAAYRKATSKRRALKLGATVGAVNEAAIYERDKVCVYCGAAEGLTIDHVVALANGGAHAQDNLVVACKSCNSSKGTMNAEEFVRRLVPRASP